MLLTKTKESQKNEETDRRWDKGDARWGKESCFPPPPHLGKESYMVGYIFQFRQETINYEVPQRQGPVASVIYLIVCFN